jgi:hypothetical protein
MVKKILILLALSLILAGCAFFFGSPFPAYLPFVENMVDLSDKVGDVDPEWHEAYRLHLLNNFLFLTIEDQRLIILDSNLKVLKEYDGSYGRLGVYSSTAPIGYFIGEKWYNDDAPIFTDLGSGSYAAHGVGYYDSAIPGIVVFECDPSTGLLSETGGTGASVSISPGLNLEAAAYDDIATMGFLFFRNWDGDSDEAQVRSATIAGTVITLPPSINLDVSDHDPEFHYTRDGYVVTTEDKSQLFNLASGDEEKAIYGGRVEQFASAYDIDGNTFYYFTFYYFNGDNKTLYRCNTWW